MDYDVRARLISDAKGSGYRSLGLICRSWTGVAAVFGHVDFLQSRGQFAGLRAGPAGEFFAKNQLTFCVEKLGAKFSFGARLQVKNRRARSPRSI